MASFFKFPSLFALQSLTGLNFKAISMLKSILLPNKNNAVIWTNTVFLLLLLLIGKASPLVILFAYFLETIIIGVFNFLKMLIVFYRSDEQRRSGSSSDAGKPFFFLVHYGGFVAIQSIFAFAFFSLSGKGPFKEPFNILENYDILLSMESIGWVLTSMLAANLAYFYTNFWSEEQYHNCKVDDLFAQPYVRIFIQQFVVILACFFMVISGEGFAAAILLLAFRLFVDLVVVGLRQNGELVEGLARKLSNTEQEYEQAKEVLLKWSE